MSTSSDTYPSHITWKISLKAIDGVSQLWDHKRVTRTLKAMEKIASLAPQYQFSVEQVNGSFLQEFVPLYHAHISAKKGGTVFDVLGKVSAGIEAGKTYEAIALRRDNVLVGGLVYRIGIKVLAVAYRVFPFALDIKLPISCSYIAEKYLVERALALEKQTITHGVDRNPYGIHAGIGVAEYKLGIGCVPYVSPAPKVGFAAVSDVHPDQDWLLMMGDTAKEKVKDAILFLRTTEPIDQKYAPLIHNPDIHVEVRQWK